MGLMLWPIGRWKPQIEIESTIQLACRKTVIRSLLECLTVPISARCAATRSDQAQAIIVTAFARAQGTPPLASAT